MIISLIHKMKIMFLAMMMARLSIAFVLPLALQQRYISSRLLLSQQTDGIMNMPEPSPTSAAYSLYHLIHQNRMNNNRNAIPLAGVYDALSAKVFAQNGSPALFLSGFGVSASLLGLPDAGMTTLTEMEQVARNICSIVRSPECQRLSNHPPPVIIDGDTGYGGASNMLRTISSLGSAGASAISIEDQQFPKKCTIAAGSKIQIVDRDEAIERIRGAIGARNLYNERYQSPNSDDAVGPWIIARTDCRMAYGFDEVVERCLAFEKLGAEIIYAENLQSCSEYEQLRARLDPKTVTMIAQVQETNNVKDMVNGKPLLTTQEIGELGYDLSLFGVSPLQCVIGALESCAKEFLGPSNGIISAQTTMTDFANMKKIVGFDELQDFESEFPCISTSTSTTVYADDEDLIPFPIPDDEIEEDKATIEIINGTTEGFIVTKMYKYPLEGIPLTNDNDESISISKIFASTDIKRLKLEPKNVTLPSALMLLDPEKYPTQSRARKAIRQRSICISRYNQQLNTMLKFDELGKVIARIYPGDRIGRQRRSGDDYYAVQGATYRPPPFNVPVLYEDDHMAIVNKPAGVVLYRAEGGRGGGARGGGQGRDTLLSALPYFLKPASNDTNIDDDDVPLRRPQPIHRLDRPTSGCLVVAKRKKSLTHLAQQFEFRRVKKTYMAIVNGVPEVNETTSGWNTIDYELDGKTAITKWRVIKTVQSLHGKGGQLTLVELKPLMGRYHQLRRHMAWVLKCPIVGDSTYDDDDDSAKRLRKRGLFLCSNELVVAHPYYNTPAGHKEWTDMSQSEKSCYGDDAELYEDDTGIVMVKASISLPEKFYSFLEREDARANKFS